MNIEEKLSDLWQTPGWLFDNLNKRFKFDVDFCASDHNKKTDYYTQDFLDEDAVSFYLRELNLRSGFLNPPYSNIPVFAKKAWELSKQMTVVCLLKADASTKWWGTFWDYSTQQPKAGCSIEYPNYINKNQGRRVKFDPPPKHVLEEYLEQGTDKDKKLAKSLLAGKVTTPAFASAIVVMDRRHLQY